MYIKIDGASIESEVGQIRVHARRNDGGVVRANLTDEGLILDAFANDEADASDRTMCSMHEEVAEVFASSSVSDFSGGSSDIEVSIDGMHFVAAQAVRVRHVFDEDDPGQDVRYTFTGEGVDVCRVEEGAIGAAGKLGWGDIERVMAEPSEPARRELHVVVKPLVDEGDMDPDDVDAVGVYAVMVDSDLPLDQAAEVAVDVFHDQQGIEVVDDFDIYVIDPSTGAVLERADDVEELGDLGAYSDGVVEKVSDEIPEQAAPAKSASMGM